MNLFRVSPSLLTNRIPRSTRWVILAVFLVVYIAAYLLLYPLIQTGASAFVILPVSAAAWFFGRRIGIWSGLAFILLNVGLFLLTDPNWLHTLITLGLPGGLVVFFTAFLVGELSDTHRRAQRDLLELQNTHQAFLLSQSRYKVLLKETQAARDDARRRSADLARSNAFINALGHVAARLHQPEPDAVLQALVEELQPLGVSCMVAMRDEQSGKFISHYSTIQVEIARGLKSLPPGVGVFEFPADHFPVLEDIQRQRTIFSAHAGSVLEPLLVGLPPDMSQALSDAVQITSQTRALFLPLAPGGEVTGLLALWSNELEESDMPAAEAFANQVTAALRNAHLYTTAQHQAITDYLTGLYNRRGLDELGQREVERATRFGRPLSLMMIDIDHFKQFNDRYSYRVGDQVLQGLADRIRSNIRAIDIPGRYGGEEFVVMVIENPRPTALPVAQRLHAAISEQPFETESGDLRVTVSIGLVGLESRDTDFSGLVAAADKALHLAKENGRNRVEVI